jgi:hypothetical protein
MQQVQVPCFTAGLCRSCIEPTFGFAAALLAGAGGVLPCLMPALGMKVVTGMPREYGASLLAARCAPSICRAGGGQVMQVFGAGSADGTMYSCHGKQFATVNSFGIYGTAGSSMQP